MKVSVRDARKEDMPKVLELIHDLAVFEKEPEAVEVTLKELEAAGFDGQADFKCFVGEVNKEIVGMALVYFRFSTWKGKIVHLEDLIVKEKMRGKGVGSALYKRVLEYASEQGVKRVNWEVLDWNEDAIKFYERSGAIIKHDWRPVEMNEIALNKFLKK